ncbi:MAG: polyprenyl synthetase family protein [Mycobacteriaceae bacterium]
MIDSALPAAVDAALVTFFDARRPSPDRVAPEFTEAVGELEAFVLRGGKRMRPSFAWWGWRGAKGAAEGPAATAALHACAALELIQACALVHDDLMDASDTRRGHPAVHRAFADQHRAQHWNGDPERYGLAAAILLGDLALAWADDMFRTAVFRTAGLQSGAADRAAQVWEQMRTELMGGQLLDVLTEHRGDESPAAALRTARFKTAAYTVEHPLCLGAAMAGAAPAVEEAYARYGANVGVAFQLRDDLLGVFGDPSVTGKPAGDDVREGKRTLLMALALETADEKDRAAASALRRALGRNLDPDDVDEVRAHLVRLGAVGAVEQRITDLTRRGLSALDEVALDPDARAALQAMATAATKRTF